VSEWVEASAQESELVAVLVSVQELGLALLSEQASASASA
jgi:hypothetical protein